jgi:hypothetical protein
LPGPRSRRNPSRFAACSPGLSRAGGPILGAGPLADRRPLGVRFVIDEANREREETQLVPAMLYPGMKLVGDSADAQRWADELGIPFYEATLETNCHDISLIFSDLIVDVVGTGHAPDLPPSARCASSQ